MFLSFKKTNQLAVFVWCCCLLATSANAQFSKVLGDGNDNFFTRTKTSGGNTLSCGYRIDPVTRLPHATFCSANASGVIAWNIVLDIPSTAYDFEIIPDPTGNVAAGYLLIGRTEPSSGADNQSFVARVSPTGTLIWLRTYQQPGREALFRITRRTGSSLSGVPRYFMSGIIEEQTNIGSTLDEGVVWVIDENGTILNRWRYVDPIAFDNEIGASIINWNATELLLIGAVRANSGQNFGVVYKINETSGAVTMTGRLPNNHYVRDAYRFTNGTRTDLVITGSIINTTNNFIAKLDGTNLTTTNWSYIVNQTGLTDLGSDAAGRIYAIGRSNVNNLFAVNIYQESSPTVLVPLRSRQLPEAGTTNFQSACLWVRPGTADLVYADARNRGASSLGGLDLLWMKTDLNLVNFTCKTPLDSSLMPFQLPVQQYAIRQLDHRVELVREQKVTPLEYKIADYCAPPPNCCRNTRIVKTEVKPCCSRLRLPDCPIKSVAVTLNAGVVFSNIAVASIGGCYTVPASHVGMNTFNLTPSGSTCGFTAIDVCPQIAPGQTAIVSYGVTFASGESCNFRDTIRCPSDCCPEVKPKYSNCHPLPLMHGTYTVAGTHCISKMTVAWTPGLNPSGNITFNNPLPQSVAWGGTGSFMYTFTSTPITNLQFSLSSATTVSGTVTVTFTLCDGTICEQKFPWNRRRLADLYEVVQVRAEAPKIYATSFSVKQKTQGDAIPRFIGLGFANRDEIANFMPSILAVTGAKNPVDPADPKAMSLLSAANGKLNAVFELDDTPFENRVIQVVYNAAKPDLRLAYLIFDEEGNVIGENSIQLTVQSPISTTATQSPDLFKAKLFLSPNPATESLTIGYATTKRQTVRFEIVDAMGKIAESGWTEEATPGDNQFIRSVGHLPAGMYFLKIRNPDGQQTARFEVIR